MRSPQPMPTPTAQALPMLRRLLEELPLKAAVRLASEFSGAPRNALYEEALRIKASAPD